MSVLLQITLILAIALLLVPLCKRLNIPSALGYIITGVIAGTSGFALVDSTATQLQMTQVSLFLLLFWIGLQLRPERLTQISQSHWMIAAILSGVSTVVFTALSSVFLMQNLNTSLAIGIAASFSATTLVIQHLNKQDQLVTTHGQISYSVLTIQALLSILCIAVIPLLSGIPSTEHGVAYFAVILMTFTGLFLSNRYVFQPLYQWITKSGSHELHILVALFISLGLYALMNLLGIHFLLAALFAGILLADSDFRPVLESSIKPFLGLFIGLSFIALGLYINLYDLIMQPTFIMLGVISLVFVKFMTMFNLARFYQHSWRNSSLLAASLAQVGELGFVIIAMAVMEGLLTPELMSSLLLILSLSMLLSPMLYWLLDRHILPRLDRHNHLFATFDTDSTPQVTTPILLIGFGRFGQIVTRILKQQQHHFAVMDSSIEATHLLESVNIPFYQADATEHDALLQAGIEKVHYVVIAIDDIEDSMLIVRTLKWNYPHIQLMARARDRHHAQLLRDLAVDHIWRETYSSALSLSEHLLVELGQTSEQAKSVIQDFEQHDSQLLKAQHQFDSMNQSQFKQSSVLSELEYLLAQDHFLEQVKHSDSQQ